jgi:hypothetical protein
MKLIRKIILTICFAIYNCIVKISCFFKKPMGHKNPIVKLYSKIYDYFCEKQREHLANLKLEKETFFSYMEEERKHWEESGKPEKHIYHDIKIILSNTEEFRRTMTKEIANDFSPKYAKAWLNVFDYYLEDEKKHWEEAGKPKNHFYLCIKGMEAVTRHYCEKMGVTK